MPDTPYDGQTNGSQRRISTTRCCERDDASGLIVCLGTESTQSHPRMSSSEEKRPCSPFVKVTAMMSPESEQDTLSSTLVWTRQPHYNGQKITTTPELYHPSLDLSRQLVPSLHINQIISALTVRHHTPATAPSSNVTTIKVQLHHLL